MKPKSLFNHFLLHHHNNHACLSKLQVQLTKYLNISTFLWTGPIQIKFENYICIILFRGNSWILLFSSVIFFGKLGPIVYNISPFRYRILYLTFLIIYRPDWSVRLCHSGLPTFVGKTRVFKPNTFLEIIEKNEKKSYQLELFKSLNCLIGHLLTCEDRVKKCIFQ